MATEAYFLDVRGEYIRVSNGLRLDHSFALYDTLAGSRGTSEPSSEKIAIVDMHINSLGLIAWGNTITNH